MVSFMHGGTLSLFSVAMTSLHAVPVVTGTGTISRIFISANLNSPCAGKRGRWAAADRVASPLHRVAWHVRLGER